MAFWGAPVDDPNHAWKGATQHSITKKLTELRHAADGPPEDGRPDGLNTGVAVAGMMGSMKKLNYTIIGDPVNLASRLEGANKQYGTRIMVSDSTRIAAGDNIITRPLDLIRVKGKTEPTAVHELVAKSGEASQQHLDLIGVFSEAPLPRARRTGCDPRISIRSYRSWAKAGFIVSRRRGRATSPRQRSLSAKAPSSGSMSRSVVTGS